MSDYLEKYQKRREILTKNKEDRKKALQKAIDKYEKIEKSDIDRKEERLRVAKSIISMKQNALLQVEEELEYLRPENEEDVEYRLRQYDEFAKKMQEILPDDLPLRFHGCPIYTAKHILESGEISSSVDRLGYETSYDGEDQISVTTKDTLDTTIQGYARLSNPLDLPAGCVFVLLPKDEMDEKAGNSMLMGNVNFKEEPSRLYGIITTPENIERVSKWAQDNEVDASKIYDFDEFAKSFEKSKEEKTELEEECEAVVNEVCEKYGYDSEDKEGNDSLKTVLLKLVPIMLENRKPEDRQLFYQMLRHTPIAITEKITKEGRDRLVEQYIGDVNPHIVEERTDLTPYDEKIGDGAYVSEPILDENLQVQGKKSFIYVQKGRRKRKRIFWDRYTRISFRA